MLLWHQAEARACLSRLSRPFSPESAAAAKGRSRASLCCSALPERSSLIRSCSRFFALKLLLARSEHSALHREMTSLSRLASADEEAASPSCVCTQCPFYVVSSL